MQLQMPLSAKPQPEATHSEPLLDLASSSRSNQMSLGPCMDESSCVKIHRQNLPSFARALVPAVSTTSSECRVVQIRKKDELPKPSITLDRDLLRDSSSRDSRRTVWSKQHLAHTNPELDIRGYMMEYSLQSGRVSER